MFRKPSVRSAALAALVVASLAGTAAAQHPIVPSKANGVYDMTTWTPIPIETCTNGNNSVGCTKVYGFDWFPDGRMVIATSDYIGQDQKPYNRARSKVSIITNPGTNSATVKTVASHFKQPAGVKVVNDRIWVTDMDTVYTIPNNNPSPADTSTNRTPRFRLPLSTDYNGHLAPLNYAFNKSTCSGFPQGVTCTSTNSQAHHYVFTPVYYQGKFYAAYGDATGAGSGLANLNTSSFYGSALLVWDSTTTALDTLTNRAFAGGFRSPNGTALGPNGSIFVSDHQGAYVPMNTIALFKVGAPRMQHGGYRLAPGYSQNFAQTWWERGLADYVPPLAVHRYRRNQQSGWVGIGQPYYLTQGAYAGQLLVGDVNSRGLWRVALDTLRDTTGTQNVQGAVFVFTPGNSANTLGTGNAGLDRITQGPDGTIYAGGGRGIGNWSGGPSQHLVYVFKPKANPTQFEIMKIRSLKDGYELILNKKVNPATVRKEMFNVGQRSWARQSAYGLGMVPANTGGGTDGIPNFIDRTIDSVQVSLDSMRIRLKVSGIKRINQERRGDSVTHWHTRFLFRSTTITGPTNDRDTTYATFVSASGDTNYTLEADYAQNWINADSSWTGGSTPIDTTPIDTVVSLRPGRFGQLEKNVWMVRAPGVIRVNVDNMNAPYRLSLRDVAGKVVYRSGEIAAHTRATEIKAPGSTQGVYTLEVRSGAEAYTRIVTF